MEKYHKRHGLQLRSLFLSCLLAMGVLTGCAGQQAEQESEPAVIETVLDQGITVDGTTVHAAGKTIDLEQKNEYIRQIVSCRWLEGNKLAIESALQGSRSQALYFVVYDVVRDLYLYEQYGKQFIWQNDDLDLLVYVVDYAAEGESSYVMNRKDNILYTSKPEEQIVNISYVPKGIKVELTDLAGENSRQVIVEAAS